MADCKIIDSDAKHILCQMFIEKIHSKQPDHPDHKTRHYAAILPSGPDSGWYEKVSFRN